MQPDIQKWITYIKDKPIPVFANTLLSLKHVCARDDNPIQKIVNVVEQDPGLTVQLLRTCNDTGNDRLQKEIVSIKQAIMLVGVKRLYEIAVKLPVLDKYLKQPAIGQLLRVFCRAYHAGQQAMYWARQRHDMTPDEVFAATQLHFLGEMILCMYDPEKLLKAFKLRRDRNIASEEAQYLVLGYTLDQLSIAIARAWKLPSLVIEALQAENASNPRGFGIMLAVQLARSATIDWYSDRTVAIQESAAELLDTPYENIVQQSHQLAISIARDTQYKTVMQAASLLPQLRMEPEETQIKQTMAEDYEADVCLSPQMNILQEIAIELKSAVQTKQPMQKILRICLRGLHDGVGLNRVVFAQLENEQHELQAKAIFGADNDPVFSRFSITLDQPHLFKRLMEKTQAICINDENRQQYWSLIPDEFQKLIGTNSFAAMSIFTQNNFVGIVYADRHTSSCQIDNRSYQLFKKLCSSLVQAWDLTQPGNANIANQ